MNRDLIVWIGAYVAALALAVIVSACAGPSMDVRLRYPGQWPGYTNSDRVPFDPSAKLTMKSGALQALFPVIASDQRITNLYFDVFLPSDRLAIIPSRIWQRADLDGWRPPSGAAERYSRYTGVLRVLNAGQGLTWPEAIEFRALQAGPAIVYWRLTAAELGKPRSSYAIVQVQP